MKWLWLPLSISAALVRCEASAPTPPGPPKQIGGITVSGETLRDGAKVFSFRCVTCHGQRGDGEGPTGRAQNPKPRDFRTGSIKFGSVPAGELAADADYARIITHGLKGTNMLALPLAPHEVDAVTQYVKSLSDKWLDPNAKAGTPIVQSPDVWGDASTALTRGNELIAQRCTSCHATSTSEGTGSDSLYGFLKAPKLEKGMIFKAGKTRDDIYRTLAAGIGGTQMKPLKNELNEQDLWALVYAVEALAD